MLTVRKAGERGHVQMGWLDSHHSFSFGSYYDPEHMGFRALRVINDDRVAPGGGFPPHGHRDMEIISYVVEGGLEHRDSMGHGAVLRYGDVQRMSAGRGVQHSEFNASRQEEVRFLQIWIQPRAQGLPASYEDRHFDPEARRNRLVPLVTPEGQGQALEMQQDAWMLGALLDPGAQVTHTLAPGRHAWVQVVRGQVEVNGQALAQGDGAALSQEASLTLRGLSQADVLVFDLG